MGNVHLLWHDCKQETMGEGSNFPHSSGEKTLFPLTQSALVKKEKFSFPGILPKEKTEKKEYKRDP